MSGSPIQGVLAEVPAFQRPSQRPPQRQQNLSEPLRAVPPAPIALLSLPESSCRAHVRQQQNAHTENTQPLLLIRGGSLSALDGQNRHPVSPYPLNLGGGDSPPKFRGRSVRNPLFYSVFSGPPPKIGGESSPLKFRGFGLTGQSPIASVQRTRPTLASHSAIPRGTNAGGCLTPPFAIPKVAEKAPWRSLQSGVAGV